MGTTQLSNWRFLRNIRRRHYLIFHGERGEPAVQSWRIGISEWGNRHDASLASSYFPNNEKAG